MWNQSHVLFVRKVNAIWAYPKFLQFSMLFQHWRKWVGTRLPSETQQMREWTNESKQTNRIHNAFCLHYGQRSIVSHHLIRPQTWWEVMDIESNELATVEDTGRGFAPSTQHIHLRFGVSLVRHLYENQEEFPGMLTGWFVEYLCQAEMEDSSRPGHSHSHRSFNSTVRAAINSIAPSFDNEPAPTHPIELAHLELSIFLSWLKAVERDFICTTHDNIITVTTEDYGIIRLSEDVYNNSCSTLLFLFEKMFGYRRDDLCAHLLMIKEGRVGCFYDEDSTCQLLICDEESHLELLYLPWWNNW